MAVLDSEKTRRGGITMSSLQRTVSRALAVKGLNKKQAHRKHREIQERKLREKEKEREKHEHTQDHMH